VSEGEEAREAAYTLRPLRGLTYRRCRRSLSLGPSQTDMGAGHFSYNDRYVYLREKAFEYAWLLHTLGVKV
jgi:hypothetical protein